MFNNDYAYFSSTSSSWLEHAARYSAMITEKLRLDSRSFVIEIASNDGYLLKNFVAAGIPCLGIEPTASTAAAAEKLGIPVIRDFFGSRLATELIHQGKQADLVLGNNVFAHVPDINDFTIGLKLVLKPGGTTTLEFPHLMQLLKHTQFDTVYHEHFSYLSLYTVERIFKQAGLKIWDVEEVPTHGGSLRIYGCHQDDPRSVLPSVTKLLQEELLCGMQLLEVYQSFQAKADDVKNGLLLFLLEQKRAGKKVAAYGAATKGNTPCSTMLA
ncbi:MAG: class I SAM-dependent methyltransferase [Trichlorobacter sp.]|uniref:methyltransferase domain-containing protein n=1 Tax=Trichlorobacter sp. TaxID=2911007 RepID=UPI00255D3E67|nr:methyltransferase domain-containing protein [Trichlorobacter sp.]MDK9719217.1 class I SAM-dependent methyltransferase [Trichlorobacter sp.]